MISKKTLLYTCLVGIGLFFLASYSRSIGLCPVYSYSSCANLFDNLSKILSLPFTILLLLAVTYRMHDDVYKSWINFASWWIPLSLLVVLITPFDNGWLYPIASREGVAFSMLISFIAISLILIIWKYFVVRRADFGKV